MSAAEDSNPFAPIRATDYTDAQINELWVEMGDGWMAAVMQPRSMVSKYILGSKGSGKTHLLRYHSYQLSRLRQPEATGLSLVEAAGCLAVFLRTTNMDAGRFVLHRTSPASLQHLFSVHLELKLVELALQAAEDIQRTTGGEAFNDADVLRHLITSVADPALEDVKSLGALKRWVGEWLKVIDDATNAAAFTGVLDLRLPFALGNLALPFGVALRSWHPTLEGVNLIYVLDEIENLSEAQQEVLNTLVRYSEGRVTFRMTGRLYARKTLATIAEGEENREGSEFSVVRLDEILRQFRNYGDFATRFIARRLGSLVLRGSGRTFVGFTPQSAFEEISVERLVERHALPALESRFARALADALDKAETSTNESVDVVAALVDGFDPLLQRLNVLLFCKKFSRRRKAMTVALAVRAESQRYAQAGQRVKSSYATAVGHWKWDLIAQLCRESRRRDAATPYAGFGTFVAMSSHNPRNLLVLLGKIYETATFRAVDFARGSRLSVDLQTSAAQEAARFCFEGDSNYGIRSDQAREAVSRLADLLRVARYALNIPEVSPLAISFDNEDLSRDGRGVLESAFNYSLLFEIGEGRPDRNTQRLMRKIQLNPMLSPRWGLPVGRRGDLSISAAMLNAIFDPAERHAFEVLVKQQSTRWNLPFSARPKELGQVRLF